jgi:hypothetical protein
VRMCVCVCVCWRVSVLMCSRSGGREYFLAKDGFDEIRA